MQLTLQVTNSAGLYERMEVSTTSVIDSSQNYRSRHFYQLKFHQHETRVKDDDIKTESLVCQIILLFHLSSLN